MLIYNRLEDNFHLANKKALFMNISSYYRSLGVDPFEVAIPLTFHIKSQQDPEFRRFIEVYSQFKKEKGNANIWIIKPGENSNRGCGIQVAENLGEIKSII
jgi:tubulin--tyrosine ligase